MKITGALLVISFYLAMIGDVLSSAESLDSIAVLSAAVASSDLSSKPMVTSGRPFYPTSNNNNLNPIRMNNNHPYNYYNRMPAFYPPSPMNFYYNPYNRPLENNYYHSSPHNCDQQHQNDDMVNVFRGYNSNNIRRPDLDVPYPSEKDQEISDEEALKNLVELKEIYDQNKDNEGVVLPSIAAASRIFLTLNTGSFVSFLNSFSFTTTLKTKTYIKPTIG